MQRLCNMLHIINKRSEVSQFHPEHLIHDVYWVDFLLKHNLHGAEAAPYSNLKQQSACILIKKKKVLLKEIQIFLQTQSIFVLWDLYVPKRLLVLPNTTRSYFWMWLGEMIKTLSLTSGQKPIVSALSYHDISALRDNVSSEAILISATNRGCCKDNLISLTGCYAKLFSFFLYVCVCWHFCGTITPLGFHHRLHHLQCERLCL